MKITIAQRAVAKTAPTETNGTTPQACTGFSSYYDSALSWFKFGLNVIPIVPGTKLPAVQWDPWLTTLSIAKIRDYWSRHPDHELGFIVGDDIIVFDADSPEAIAALAALERKFEVTPTLIVKTTKGLHHYFRRANGTHAKSDSHSTDKHPERIDIKTGRALVILPPSTGKTIAIGEANHGCSDLTEVGQDFIEAVFQHNGRGVPRQGQDHVVASRPNVTREVNSDIEVSILALLEYIDPDCGYDDWLIVGMAIHYETQGSNNGFALFDNWSRAGSKYKGNKETSTKWKSFRLGHSNPVTLSTLKKMVADNGHDWMTACAEALDKFERIGDGTGGAI